MCLCVYIGTNQNLDIGEFVANETLLYLEIPTEDELNNLKKKFTKKHIFYVGSNTCCSCGFMYEKDEDFDDEENDTASPLELIKFLKDNSKYEDIEFYSCWEKEWNLPAKSKIEININNLNLENYFGPEQLQFITFKNEK